MKDSGEAPPTAVGKVAVAAVGEVVGGVEGTAGWTEADKTPGGDGAP